MAWKNIKENIKISAN